METINIIFLLFIVFLAACVIRGCCSSSSIFGSGKKKKSRFLIVSQEPWFSHIKSGKKKVEGRVGDPSKFESHVGETVKISVPQGEKLLAKLTKVKAYYSLDDFIKGEGWKELAPHAKSEADAKKLYLDIKNKDGAQVYSEENIKSKGKVIALHIDVIKK